MSEAIKEKIILIFLIIFTMFRRELTFNSHFKSELSAVYKHLQKISFFQNIFS